MKFYKTGIAILLSTTLFACDSDDNDNNVPDVVTITAELGLTGNNGVASINNQGYPLMEFRDAEGYAHFLRTDSYRIKIIDSIDGYGEDYFLDLSGKNHEEGSLVDIAQLSEFQFSAQGDALVQVIFSGEHSNEGAYKYYTAFGENEINRETQSVRVEVNNTDYSFVVFRTTDSESLSLIETNVNDVTFGAVREVCIPGRAGEVCTQDPYSYNYITVDSIAEFVSYAGESFTKEIIIDPSAAPGIIDFGLIAINEESGSIIIKEPTFDPIKIGDPVEAVLTNADLTGGSIIETSLDTGAVIVKGNKDELWGYPETMFFKGDKTLSQYTVNLEIEEDEVLTENNVIANIYIERINQDNNREEKAFSLVLTGNVGEVIDNETMNKAFNTYNEFLAVYGDWTVSSKPDSGRVQTNFIVRFGDSSQDATNSSWLVKQFSIVESN